LETVLTAIWWCTISANARRRQQGERHAHPRVRVLGGGSDIDRKLLMAGTPTA
jgi:hypothetical protein